MIAITFYRQHLFTLAVNAHAATGATIAADRTGNAYIICHIPNQPDRHRGIHGYCPSPRSRQIRSWSILTAIVLTHPSSGACTCPVGRSMTMPCSGQVTETPCTSPADRGPPLWGHLSTMA